MPILVCVIILNLDFKGYILASCVDFLVFLANYITQVIIML